MTVVELNHSDELIPLVHAALRSWYQTGPENQGLLDGLLLIQDQRSSDFNSTSPTALRLATNQVLLNGIEELEESDQTGGRVLRHRFADDLTLIAVGNRLNVSQHSVSRIQRHAINLLSQILFEREMELRRKRIIAVESQLEPPTYTQLFGLEDAAGQLLKMLAPEETPRLVAIVGIGGIGKTALADSVSRHIARQLVYENIVWIRFEPQTMSGYSPEPKLAYDSIIIQLAGKFRIETSGTIDQLITQVRQRLKSQLALVVIDNLEADAETIYLLDHINDLAGPSKFLITCRTRPAPQATVYHFPMDELSLQDATALLRHHARDLGIDDLEDANEKDIQTIYEVVGGNPLALKMVVSQLDLLSISQIINDLTDHPSGAVEDMYNHIYRRTWQLLSKDARSLLQAMPIVGESGGLPDYLQSIANLDETSFWPALQELRMRSLLEVRGTIQEKRYGIHRLTESFLRTEIIDWKGL